MSFCWWMVCTVPLLLLLAWVSAPVSPEGTMSLTCAVGYLRALYVVLILSYGCALWEMLSFHFGLIKIFKMTLHRRMLDPFVYIARRVVERGIGFWIFRMLSGAVVVSYRAVLGTCVQVTMYGRWKKIMRILSVSFVILWYRFPRMASTNLVGICAPYTWLHVWDFGLRFPMGWKHCLTANHCFLLLMIFNT